MRGRWDVPPCNVLFVLQPRQGCTPLAEEGKKKEKATVLLPEDAEPKEIHILRGYNMLSNAAGWVALNDEDMGSFLSMFGEAD